MRFVCSPNELIAPIFLLNSQDDPNIDAARSMNMATTTSKALLNVLENSLSGETTVSQCQPQVVYMIFTIAIGFLCCLRGLKDASGAVTKRLDAQMALHSCSEALGKMAETWPLARKYGRAVQVLMDAEGLESLEFRSNPQHNLAVNPSERRNDSSARSQNDFLGNRLAGTSSLSTRDDPGNMADVGYYMDQQALSSAAVSSLPQPLPTIEDILGTTGWGTESLDQFDLSDTPFDRHNTGLDPELHAFLNNFATVPGHAFSGTTYGVEDGSYRQAQVSPYDGVSSHNQDPRQSHGVGSLSGPALDLLARSATGR